VPDDVTKRSSTRPGSDMRPPLAASSRTPDLPASQRPCRKFTSAINFESVLVETVGRCSYTAVQSKVSPKERRGPWHNETLRCVPCASHRPLVAAPRPLTPRRRGQGDDRREVTSRAGHNVSGILQRGVRGQEPTSHMSTTTAAEPRTHKSRRT
jgi:hypothetical protein